MTELHQALEARPLALLGPQKGASCVREVIERMGLEGLPLATVTAGWEERESEDTELDEVLGGQTRNLGLFPRAEDVFRKDPDLRAAMYRRYDRLNEQAELYRAQLGPILEVMRELIGRLADGAEHLRPDLRHAASLARALDTQRLARADGFDAAVFEELRPWERTEVARHRDELRGTLDGVAALLIAGGHVGILLNRLRLFGVLDLLGTKPIVAWSSGAMACTERVVLFHDCPPQGPGNAEVYGRGLCLARGIVALPDAARRLRMDDPVRSGLLAERFGEQLCVALDGSEWMLGDQSKRATEWSQAQGARGIYSDGVRPLAERGAITT